MVETAAREPVPHRRADAGRAIAAILEAGVRLLGEDPGATMADIAAAAGLSRVTLYGCFPSREALIDAVLDHAVDVADSALRDESFETDPAPEAITRLLRSSWRVLDRHRRLFLAADRALGGERMREHHDRPLRRVRRLIERGREAGDFRTDLPLPWLVTTFYAILSSAAQEVEAGRLKDDEAETVLVQTVRSLLTG
uniref:TetR/AcrR family transcriptional regulator n=1 Tax=Nonomuraea pusilla TaxID=46177 RepID=UPI0006E14DA7|nr:TetR family transcriptional regulator [Nonomuraea pusilla]